MEILEKCYKKDPDIVYRKIAKEYILVPIRHKLGDLENIYSLNEVSARIWELIDGRKKVKEIKDKIVEEFEVSPKEAEKDLVEFIQQLKAIDVIKN